MRRGRRRWSGRRRRCRRRANVSLPPVDEDRGYDIVDVARSIAEAHDASVAQVSLAWLLHKPGVTSVIVGARKEEQLVDNLGAADLELTADEMARLDDVSQLNREYPAWTSGSVQRGQDMASRLAQMG